MVKISNILVTIKIIHLRWSQRKPICSLFNMVVRPIRCRSKMFSISKNLVFFVYIEVLEDPLFVRYRYRQTDRCGRYEKSIYRVRVVN